MSAALSHPALVPVLESGAWKKGWVSVNEYVRGCSLNDVLDLSPQLSLGIRYRIARQIAEIALYLLEQNLLHRDYKPENFRVEPGGRLRLLDFGLAQQPHSPYPQRDRAGVEGISEGGGTKSIRGSGKNKPEQNRSQPMGNLNIRKQTQGQAEATGTLAYLAPECLLRSELSTTASDIYSICLTLSEWLCGRRLFPQQDYGSLAAAVADGLGDQFLEDLSPSVAKLLYRGLASSPTERLSDMSLLVEALSEMEGSHPLPLGDRSLGLIRHRVDDLESRWLLERGRQWEREGRWEDAWSLARERLDKDDPDSEAEVDYQRLTGFLNREEIDPPILAEGAPVPSSSFFLGGKWGWILGLAWMGSLILAFVLGRLSL
jgi:serine/threonine protein kinase